MSSKVGMLLKCDRCGAEVFLECIGEGERDGGYTRWNKFEDRPEGWTNSTPTSVGTLCPKCNKLWEHTIKTFMEDLKHEQG